MEVKHKLNRGYNGSKTQTEVIEDTMELKHKLK